jgi:astacin (peptidase family M12A)
MSETEDRLREALSTIARVAGAAVDGGYSADEEPNGGSPVVCTPKTLPQRLLVNAAKTAVKINPVNAPVFGPLATVGAGLIMDPQRISVIVSKYWGPTPRRLTVSFVDSTPADLRAKIISHMNAWTKTACVSFVETQGGGSVRISRGSGGYWSYLGTDILHIPKNRQTMNLQGFTMRTPDSEYRRVVRHETGHTLGFPHEHMRKALVALIDPDKAYEYFLRTQGWDKQTVDQQVLTSLDEGSLMGTPVDQDSIMCYQLPGSITKNGQPIRGGTDINQTDYSFASRIYPQPGHELMVEQHQEWEPSEDVRDPVMAVL